MCLGLFYANKMQDSYTQLCQFENIYRAYVQASRAKHYKSAILQYSANIEENLLQLRDELESKEYVHGEYRHFTVHDSKKRQIMSAPFKDRVMHHALCNIIDPIFDKGFIYDSYACRCEKGTHRAVKRLKKFLRCSEYRHTYILKCDISKYFDSINHKILFRLIKKRINNKDVLTLLSTIINSANTETGVGIPIGNLTSQLFANIYLNELDQFIKHKLRVKHYIRYMDDFVILDVDKKRLAEYRSTIGNFVREKLALTLHPYKSTISPVRLGVDFLGYRIFEHHTKLRKSTVKRFVKRTKLAQKSLENGNLKQEDFDMKLLSWNAYANHAQSWQLRKKIGEELDVKLV